MAISDLKGIIDAIIKTNGRQEITGASLNEVLTQMVNELDVASELSNKVDKELGKGLSTNDFTTSEKDKLAGLENYNDTTLKEQLAELSAEVGKKQDTITDLETIRSGAAKGATALQSVPATYATKTYVDEAINDLPTPSASNEWKCVYDGRMEVGARFLEFATYADGTPLKAMEAIVQVYMDESSTQYTQGYVIIHSTNNATDSLYGAIYYEKNDIGTTPQFCQLSFKASPAFMLASMIDSARTIVAQGAFFQSRLGNKIPPQIYEDITYIKLTPNAPIAAAAPLVKIYAR